MRALITQASGNCLMAGKLHLLLSSNEVLILETSFLFFLLMLLLLLTSEDLTVGNLFAMSLNYLDGLKIKLMDDGALQDRYLPLLLLLPPHKVASLRADCSSFVSCFCSL